MLFWLGAAGFSAVPASAQRALDGLNDVSRQGFLFLQRKMWTACGKNDPFQANVPSMKRW